MKKFYFLKFLCLGIVLFAFTETTNAQGDCDDLSLPILAKMGLDTQPAGFFVRAGGQTGRIFRDGVPSVCPFKIYPGDFNPGNPYNWTAVRLYNSDAGPICITVNADVDSGGAPCTTNGHAHVYQEAGGANTEPYDPADQPTNYLGDVGSSVSQGFAIEVGPGWFEVVFTNTTSPDNCDFSFSIDDGGTGAIQCDDGTVNTSDFLLNKMELYPNPASDVVNIKLAGGILVSNVELINVSGKTIYSGTLVNNKLNLNGIAAGVYFVKVTSENATATKKLIVK